MRGSDGRRRPVAAVLTSEFSSDHQSVVAIDASVGRCRAYLAVRGADGEVRPVYLRLEADPTDEDFLDYKDLDIEESPSRWPLKVAAALTTWEQ